MSNDKKVFDREEFLERTMGDELFLKEIMDDFFSDIGGRLKFLKEGVDLKDLDIVKSQAHSIKGASGNVTASMLETLMEKIEVAASESNFIELSKLVHDVEEQFQILYKIVYSK